MRKIGKLELSFRRIYPLQVHCWGGLGSQLYAWAVVEELLNCNYDGGIKLILHTSGVTERASEIDALRDIVPIEQIHDFRSLVKSKHKKSSRIHRFLNSMICKTRLVVKTDEVTEIMPWTMQLRGHYSRRFIPAPVIQDMKSRFLNLGLLDFSTSEHGTAVHYRLGDLIALTEKTFIEPSQIINGLSRDSRFSLRQPIEVYSDSPNLAIQKLMQNSEGLAFIPRDLPSWQTLSKLTQFPYLVITNSKIGIWALLFRNSIPDRCTMFPGSLGPQIRVNLGNEYSSNRLISY